MGWRQRGRRIEWDGDRLGGRTNEEVSGCVQRLNPVASGNRNLEEKAMQHVGGGANHGSDQPF